MQMINTNRLRCEQCLSATSIATSIHLVTQQTCGQRDNTEMSVSVMEDTWQGSFQRCATAEQRPGIEDFLPLTLYFCSLML